MGDEKNVLLGILAIILGLIILAFPLVSVFTVSLITGFAIIFLGIWVLGISHKVWGKSLAAGIADLLLAIIVIFIGLGFVGNVAAVSFLTVLAVYVAGFFLIITGFTNILASSDIKDKIIGILGIIFGIIYMVMGIYAANPFFLAIVIGAFLIIAGIMEIFVFKKE